MAYRPSYRRSRVTIDNLEPNMTPIMNLMVVLIPLLLSSAQLIKISVIELNLPPAKGASSLNTERPKERELKLDLAVTITDKGFYLSSSAAIMKSEQGPSLPKRDGEYDYETLSRRLYEIKQKAIDRFKDSESIIIQAEPQIDYQTLVSTMDATRSITLEGQRVSLFPKVSVSALVL
ncbi:hypothetical protein GWO43_22580 [candidate division KSB1 bacterium]|nr:hypothetical protein [candidate division KSB1 bacterium]NIR72729.1 hypothetical protein [candidate division KSB1 bacterium]NIS26817.1 hypothetical protein [candidate division KSB1 bacterium]NIT73611.1 hypothetical protein [candidate division KSB1 bacterium]NIU27484.1 hypothetical protein [candidate division KSB1 bacterium]